MPRQYTDARLQAGSIHTGDIVRGEEAQFAHLDPRPCPVPPDWERQGYGSIFSVQHKTRVDDLGGSFDSFDVGSPVDGCAKFREYSIELKDRAIPARGIVIGARNRSD